MKKTFLNICFEKEIVILSVFISSYILYTLFLGFDFSLTNCSNLYISQATINDIDVSKRISLFYKIIIGLSLLLPVTYYLLNWLKLKFLILTKDLQFLTIIASIGIAFIISTLYGVNNDYGIQFICYLFSLSLISLCLYKWKKEFRLLNNATYFGGILTLSFITFTYLLFLFNSSKSIIEYSVELYLSITVMLFIIFHLLKKIFNLTPNKIFLYLLPLSFVPIYILISIELIFYFKIKSNIFIPYKWVSLSLSFGSLVIYTIYLLLRSKKKSSSHLFSFYYIPSALFSYLLFTLYEPIVNQSQDLFELANPAIAQLRTFSFNEIPFLDFMSSHMLSEQFYGIIHHLLFGFDNNLNFITYKFLYFIIFYALAYIFMLKLLKSSFLSLVFLISLPFVFTFFSVHLFFSILIFFSILKVVRNQNIKNYLTFYFLLIFMCFWRLDLGASVVFTSLVFLPLSFIIERKKIKLNPLIKSISLFLSIALIFTLIATSLRSKELLFTNIKSALHYISASQAHGYSLIAREFNQQFFNIHLLFPVVSVLLMIYSVIILTSQTKSKFQKFSLSTSLFFFLIFLSNFQRGLVRHSFMENTDFYLMSTFYIGLVLFLISFIKNKQLEWRFIYFLTFSLGSILFLKYFPIKNGDADFNKFLSNPTLANLDANFTNQNYKGRIIGSEEFAEEKYNNLKMFLNKNLSEKQTFLDFSNSPMLYYYCKRETPSYFCQNLQNTVDDYLQIEQLKKIDTKAVPVVIYSNYPTSWWDNTDGIPNAMRQYLIAEFIYENYKPFGIINNHSIWINKGINLNQNNYKQDSIINQSQSYNYKYAASHIYKHFTKNSSKNIKEIKKQNIDQFIMNNDFISATIDSSITKLPYIFTSIQLENSHQEEVLKIELWHDNQLIGISTLTTEKNVLNYMIPISNHYLWLKNNPTQLRINTNENFKVKTIRFYKDIRNEY